MVWNQHTSRDTDKQFQGIFQGFRMVGTATKMGPAYRSSAWKFGPKITLRYLNGFADAENRCDFDDIKHVSIEKTKEIYPDWFYRHFVEGRAFGDYSFTRNIEELEEKLKNKKLSTAERKAIKKEIKKNETELKRRRAWYESWKGKLKKGAYDGNRHYCIGVLFHYAMKAEIDIEDALDDALALVPYLNSLTKKKGNEFTADDVYCAMVYYERKFIKMGRNGIKRLTTIDIGETKRKGQTQAEHLEEARAVRDIKVKRKGKENWYEGGGKPVGGGSWQEAVKKWRQDNPEGTIYRCAQELAISWNTAKKWWGEQSENRPTKQVMIEEWRKENPEGTMYRCAQELEISKNTVKKWWDCN